jgi:hypothetical protein
VLENELATVPFTYSRSALPTDRWTCIVLRVLRGSPGEVGVSIDGAPDAELQLSAETNPSPPLASVRMGAVFSQLAVAQGPVDVWLDEIAIDGAPLDCTQ